MLEQIPMTEKYKTWVDEVSAHTHAHTTTVYSFPNPKRLRHFWHDRVVYVRYGGKNDTLLLPCTLPGVLGLLFMILHVLHFLHSSLNSNPPEWWCGLL